MKDPSLPRLRNGTDGRAISSRRSDPPPPDSGWKGASGRQCSYRHPPLGRCLEEALPGLRRCGEHRYATGARATKVQPYASFFANRDLRARWKMHQQDPSLLDGRSEIAAARVVVEQMLASANMTDQETLGGLVKQLDIATRMQERYVNMVMIKAGSWEQREVRQAGIAIAQAINQIISNPFERRALLETLLVVFGEDENGQLLKGAPQILEGAVVG